MPTVSEEKGWVIVESPLLSISIIEKNEIRCLERCLKSLTPLREAISCELVVVDTGSTDGSREIASQYADILVDYEWSNDFAAARNAGLERCSGVWVLVLDADEWLEDIEGLLNFLKVHTPRETNYAMVPIRNYSNPEFTSFGESFGGRLAKRMGGNLWYSGIIHEVMSHSDGIKRHLYAMHDFAIHHDGYLYSTPEAKAKKNARNMELLRIELAQNPRDARTLTQCMASAETMEEAMDYVEQGLDVAENPECSPIFMPIIYQNAIVLLYRNNLLERTIETVETWRKRTPDGFLFRIDGEAHAIMACYGLDRYDEVYSHYQNWENALSDIERGSDRFDVSRYYSVYFCNTYIWKQIIRGVAFDSLRHVEQYDKMDQVLQKMLGDKERFQLSIGNFKFIIQNILNNLTELPHGIEMLCRFWDDAKPNNENDKEDTHKNQKTLQRNMIMAFCQNAALHTESFSGWLHGLAAMGNRPPAQAARLVCAQTDQELAASWEQVTDWTQIPNEVYYALLKKKHRLPHDFYKKTSEKMDQLAAVLSKYERFPQIVLAWLEQIGQPETLKQLAWQLDLVTAALQTKAWSNDVDLGDHLCNHYFALSSDYIGNIYRLDMLDEEDVCCLPGMHRFAWYCIQANTALEQGDELSYVQNLRLGLETAPAMKHMVDFLIQQLEERKRWESASPELLELAEKVRSILAKYPSYDPAIVALKQSEVYQKVAYLIEGIEAPVLGGQA